MEIRSPNGPAGRIAKIAVLTVLVGALGACESIRETFGLTKKSPDAFAVVTRAPLILPPDYRLRPPAPGRRAPQEQRPAQEAKAALTGTDAAAGGAARPVSAGELALLANAGADRVDPNIRAVVDREIGLLVDKDRGFVRRLLFWGGPKSDVVVDASAESARLRENATLGRPATSGATPALTQE